MINYTYTDKFIRILIYSILSLYLHDYFFKNICIEENFL